MRLLLLALSILSSHAATIRVCASGCDYTPANLQLALNAAVGGDIIEGTAGETAEGAFVLPYRTSGGVVTVRTSRYADLPTSRVGSAHTALMFKLQPNSTSTAALSTGAVEKDVASVNLGTDTLTFSAAHGFVDGQPIACRSNEDGTYPVTRNQVYYVRDAAGTTLKLALTPGAAAVDLTVAITATNFRCTDARQVRGWKFTGIEIAAKTGQVSEYNLVELGTSSETSRSSIPSAFVLDRVYIHGVREQNGPRICLFLNAKATTIVDSTIEHCHKEGEEGKAISMSQAPGPILIRNTYIAAGSINILTGGSYVMVTGLVNGDEGGITLEGNHITRPMWHKYTAGTSGAGAPSGGCTDDTWYLRTSNGQWYRCVSSAWVTGPTCADGEYYRSSSVAQNCGAGACWACASGAFATSAVFRAFNYATKNLLEFKSAMNVVVRGNIFENNWVNSDQSGPAVWVSQVAQYNADAWVRGENIRFESNIIKNSAQGLRIASSGGAFGVNNNRISVRNMLLAKIGNTDYPSITTTNGGAGKDLSFGGPCDDCSFDHISSCCGAAGGSGVAFDTAAFTRPRLSNSVTYQNQYGYLGDLGNPPSFYFGSGNIANVVGVDNLAQGTGSLGAWATQGNAISAATALYVGSGNYRLQSTSPYSAACPSSCAYASTDGKDLGVDVDMVDSASQGAASGLPWLGGSINVTAGSTRAIVRYTAPSASACTLKLYTNLARTTLHGDTDTGGEQSDDRAGNVSAGTSRQFVLGTNTALTASTQYWAVVTCGTSIGYTPLRTVATGSGFNVVVKYSSAITGEYSSSADMSSPTAISSSSTHTVPLAAVVVRYYRATGGAIQVFVAP